jgi:hypothetical protein
VNTLPLQLLYCCKTTRLQTLLHVLSTRTQLKEVEEQAAQGVEIKAAQGVEIKAAQGVEIKAAQGVEIKAAQGVEEKVASLDL